MQSHWSKGLKLLEAWKAKTIRLHDFDYIDIGQNWVSLKLDVNSENKQTLRSPGPQISTHIRMSFVDASLNPLMSFEQWKTEPSNQQQQIAGLHGATSLIQSYRHLKRAIAPTNASCKCKRAQIRLSFGMSREDIDERISQQHFGHFWAIRLIRLIRLQDFQSF